MKKITFILFALIAGTTFAQNTATETAAVNAEIIETIGISSADALNFGKFTAGDAAGTVVIAPGATPTRVFSVTDMEIVAFSTFGVPTFTVTKDANATYGIVLNDTDPTDSGSNTLILDNLTHSLSSDAGNNAADFTVGGTLNVPSGATAGVYTGEVSVTVTYE
jgi:spore coat protein U-like protein